MCNSSINYTLTSYLHFIHSSKNFKSYVNKHFVLTFKLLLNKLFTLQSVFLALQFSRSGGMDDVLPIYHTILSQEPSSMSFLKKGLRKYKTNTFRNEI